MACWDNNISVLYGRCKHRGALMADGYIEGNDLICGVHQWDYRFDTVVSAYNNSEALDKFEAWVEDDAVYVNAEEIMAWKQAHPQPYDREAYQGEYADIHGTVDEPATKFIHELATNGLSKTGHHGPVAAMGVPGPELPQWAHLQFVTAQLARLPQLEEVAVGTELVIGPRAQQPLKLDIPIFVSDISFGALSEEAKVALAKGAELAGTGICSGEGGMLPEEQGNNSRYFYELASARFGFSLEKLMQVQAFHCPHPCWQDGFCRPQVEAGAVVFVHDHRGDDATGGPVVPLNCVGHELRARGLRGRGYGKPQAGQQDR